MSTTTDLTTLKINYLTQAQYDTAKSQGLINNNELYLTPATDSGINDVTVDGVSVVTDNVAEITMPTVPTKVSDLTNDIGYITDYTETDPTVPSWAKASSKPSYTASEVGAVPTSRTINGKALTSNITLSASDVSALPSSTVIPTITDTYSGTSSNGMSGKAVKSAIDALDGTVTGTAGSSKTLTAFSQTDGKVNATFGSISITKSQVSDFPTIPSTASDVGAVPTSRKVNGKALTSDITLSASDVSALPSSTSIPTKTSDLINDSGFITGYTETDPVFTASAAHGITSSDISTWNGKSDFSGSYNDLTDKPTIPTVNNATLTIQKNGTTVKTFTANASSNVTANITVPTKVSDLTNDSGFITGYTETDPVFNASAASGIASSDITAWNGKSTVSLTRHTTSGTNIADLTINGTTTKLYAPQGGGGTLTDVTVDGTSVVSGSVAEIDLTGKADVSDIPTKVSDLTNDSGFIGATLSYYTGNIDTLYTTSVYLYNTNSTTGTFPTTAQYGTIVTIGGTSTNFAIQLCKTNEAYRELFIRFRSAGTWSDWVPISYTRGRLPSGTDLDDVKDSGSYMIGSGNTYTNLPSGVTYGLLEVVPSTIANETLLQRITTTSNVYFRFYSHPTWYGWKKIAATSV